MKPDLSYKLAQKVEKYINKHNMIRHGECVVIGLSGGADSVCLFLFLNKLKESMDFDLHAIHVNHGIRGISSERDENFSKELCEKYKVPFTSYSVNVPKVVEMTGLTTEEAGRNLRYSCFMEYAKGIDKQVKIAVAHHQNDQAETVLFNMIRGSGLKGIGGMSPVSERIFDEKFKLQIIRPLLCLTRKEIEDFLYYEEENYCTDETNLDNDYSRNQIRNNVIPELREIQQKTVEHISLMAEEAREAIEYMDSEVLKLYDKVVSESSDGNTLCYRIEVAQVKNESKIIVRQLIIQVLRKLVINYKDITRTHIEDIYSLIFKGKGKYVTLPYGLKAIKDKDYLEIRRENSEKDN